MAHKTGTANQPGSSTRSCPTYGRSEHLKETVSLPRLRKPTLRPRWGLFCANL